MPFFADHVFVNGQVITVNEYDGVYEAIAVKGNRILAVGSDDGIRSMIGRRTEVMDLRGRALLPGFIDSHLHLVLHGTNRLGITCKFPEVKSIEDIKARVKAVADRVPPGTWIRGWGYDHTKLAEGRHPTRDDLDEVAPHHPVIIVRTCAHISAVNSRALELAGIGDDPPDPPGGRIERGPDGRPTGVLKETAHMQMLKVASFEARELREAISVAAKELVSLGITSVHDAGGYGAVQFRALQQTVEEGELPLRVYGMVFSLIDNLQFIEEFGKAGPVTGFGNKRLRIGPVKVMTDGSSSGPTAATREPYSSDPTDRGILYLELEELTSIFRRFHAKGFQLTAHAVGDRAVEMVLDAFERVLSEDPRPHRHRIEHSAIMDPELMDRMARLGVVPVAQPVFLYEFGDGYLRDYGERTRYMFPCRSLLDRDIPVAGSSDCPVTTPNPLIGLRTALDRKTAGGRQVAPEEGVSMLEAVRMYTYNGAYASFEEDIKGSLEPGKLADLVVLSQPLLGTPVEELGDIEVDLTMVGGRVVYESGRLG